MDAQEIAKLCKNLSLKDKEGLLMPLRTRLKDDGEKRLALHLASRIKSNKPVNRDAFINLISRIWRLRYGVDSEVIEGNTFSFTFKDEGIGIRSFRGDHGVSIKHYWSWKNLWAGVIFERCALIK